MPPTYYHHAFQRCRRFFSLLVLFSCHPGYCRAFHPFHSDLLIKKSRSVCGMLSPGSSLQTIGDNLLESTTASSPIISNWRFIPKEADDYGNHLVQRSHWSVEEFKESLDLYERLMSCKDSYVSPAIQAALNTLDHAYRLYGPSSVICSFNGGKDAVAILHLVRAAHAKHYNSTGETPIRPRAVYFNNDDEFPGVTSFLQESVAAYDLDMIAFENGVQFSTGLEILVKNNYIVGTKAIFPMAFVLGTRISDPNAIGQNHFSPSSHWMPAFMRVNPVLDWNYGHIWHFLRLFKLPYCSLYDQGYTSLGTVKDTLPCPALAVNRGEEDHGDDETVIANNNNLPKFWPAYMLRDWEQERAGRIKKDKPNDEKNPPTRKVFGRSTSGLTTVSDLRLVNNGLKDSEKVSENNATEDDCTVQSLGTDDYNNYGEAKTVGILVVGDEILKGMTIDTNTQTAAKALRKECLKLSRAVVVSDDVHEIATEIRRLRNEVDVVVTSGGVGPTHDDVTIKGVAEALGRDLVYNEEMAKLLQIKMNNNNTKSPNDDFTSAQIKMATLPSNAKLRYLSTDEWPVLQCRNIFILPGVPEFFGKKIENVAAYLSSQLERSVAYKIVLSIDEQSIVDILNVAVKKHPKVSMGSYPFVSHPEFKTVVTLEANLVDSSIQEFHEDESSLADRYGSRNSLFLDRDAVILSKEIRDRNVRLALDDLIMELPKGSILRVENDDLDPFT